MEENGEQKAETLPVVPDMGTGVCKATLDRAEEEGVWQHSMEITASFGEGLINEIRQGQGLPGCNDGRMPSQFLLGHHPETRIKNPPRGCVGYAAQPHSPSLRSRVSVSAAAAASAMKDPCTWAAPPEQMEQSGEAGISSRLANRDCLLPHGLQRSGLARSHVLVPSPAPRGWAGGLGSCRYPLVHVPQPREDQWTLNG